MFRTTWSSTARLQRWCIAWSTSEPARSSINIRKNRGCVPGPICAPWTRRSSSERAWRRIVGSEPFPPVLVPRSVGGVQRGSAAGRIDDDGLDLRMAVLLQREFRIADLERVILDQDLLIFDAERVLVSDLRPKAGHRRDRDGKFRVVGILAFPGALILRGIDVDIRRLGDRHRRLVVRRENAVDVCHDLSCGSPESVVPAA